MLMLQSAKVCNHYFKPIKKIYLIISQDHVHRDSEPDLVFEDMTVMSDFELHCLCREEQVQCKRTLLLIIVLQKEKAIASF